MKIAYLTQSVDHVSGLGRIVAAIGSHMIARGHEVSCISQVCEEPGMQWFRIPRSHLSNGIEKLWYRLHEPRRTPSVGADVIHSMGVGEMAHILSAESCHKAGMALAKSGDQHRIRGRNWGLFDRLSLVDEHRLVTAGSTRVIVAVSRIVRDQLLEHYPIAPEKVVVIPNGIDFASYARMEDKIQRQRARMLWGIPPDVAVLLFVGNEFERKGVQTIIEALPLLQDIPLSVVVAGGDDPRAYEALSVRLGVADRVRFLGRVEGIEKLFGLADVFVFPTYYEPYGLVIREAMAAGLPVITHRHAGAVEDLENGRHGLFLDDARSASELAGQVRRVIEDPVLASCLAAEGRAATESLDWKHIGRRFEVLYEQIAGETTMARST